MKDTILASSLATILIVLTGPSSAQENQKDSTLSGARFFATHTYQCYQLTGDEALIDVARDNAILTLEGGGYTSAQAGEAIDALFAKLDATTPPASLNQDMCEEIRDRLLPR